VKAVRYLRKLSYSILATNWRCRSGEIDIIACDKRTLVIIEVKTRNANIADVFSPLSAVDDTKQKKLIVLAQAYTKSHRALLRRKGIASMRFDIMALTYTKKAYGLLTSFSVEHVQDVFR